AGTTATTLQNPLGISFDSAGNLWVADFNNNRIVRYTTSITVDTTPPTVSITSPANNTSTNVPTLQVSVTASDTSGISSVTWKVDSGSVSTASTSNIANDTTSWYFTSTISDGSHTIRVNATDNAGNVAKTKIVVTVDT